MSRSFPELNLEWLVHGKGRMYKEGRKEAPATAQTPEGQLFSAIQEEPAPLSAPQAEEPETPDSPAEAKPVMEQEVIIKNRDDYVERPKVTVQSEGRRITRIVVFYDDNTYQELREV